MTAEEVAAKLNSLGLQRHYKHVYVANTNFTTAKANALMGPGRFDSVSSRATTCYRQAGRVVCGVTGVSNS